MEKVNYLRNIKCPLCSRKLYKVYIRDNTTFKSLGDWFFCEFDKKMFKLDEKGKIK
jgi:hypothetical protein